MFENDLPAEDGRTASGRYPARAKRSALPADEPTVQVPLSLIERIAASSIENPDEDALIELSHLHSQPTPTAEHDEDCFAGEWNDAAGVTCVCTCGVEPPRIEDMAPGTTFMAQFRAGAFAGKATRWLRDAHGVVLNSTGLRIDPAGIDPSTVRDVTPPTESTK